MFCTLADEAKARGKLNVLSPDKNPGVLLQPDLCHFQLDAMPHIRELVLLAQGKGLTRLATASDGNPAALLREENVYPITTWHHPPKDSWLRKITERSADLKVGSVAASTLHGFKLSSVPATPWLQLPWGCRPEMLASAKPFHPGYNAEVKSAISATEDPPKLYDEVITYVTLDIVSSHFRDVPAGHHRFFEVPPVGYGLVACSHVGYFLAVEWIGKLFVSVVSKPFFIGEADFEAAVAALPNFDLEGRWRDWYIDAARVAKWPAEGTAKVMWRVDGHAGEGGDFFKLITFDAFPAKHFERMFTVYAAFQHAMETADDADPVPPSLRRAQLLFGAGEVCVTMGWVGGRDAAPADLDDGGCAVTPVATAIAWLARKGLAYTDLRLPNVRVLPTERDAVLVDYDDLDVGEPTRSFEVLLSRLRRLNAPWALPSGPGHMPAVLAALRELME